MESYVIPLPFYNEEDGSEELCSVHVEDTVRYYIFYDQQGKYLDFKIEVYE